ncbi:MAG TPA: hypothetical protein VFU22_21500 [Roseiflexaceae bacterium]|nr:hypothetical protein [Roseiflexaceae bacterium]
MVQRISAFSSHSPGGSPRARQRLAGWWRAGLSLLTRRVEPVDVLDQRFNFLPRSFRWRGDLWRVRSIERVWEQPHSGLRPSRRYFEVTCGLGSRYVLFQDLRIGTWHVSL